MKVSFIGLGIMGSRMAANLLKNNIDLTVYNRSSQAMETLVQQGAQMASTIKEAVREADLVITMLSTPEAVEQVMLQKGGALESMTSGVIWVDCSTVNPSFSKRSKEIATQHQIKFIDAPVAGTKPHAENAELVFFVGGEDSEVELIKPLLNYMGKKVMHLGTAGNGASFKMIVNIMLAQSMIVFSEAVLLGQKMGFDKEMLLQILPQLVVSAPFTKLKAEMIKQNDYSVQFPLEWMYKDLHLASLTAYELGQPLHLANVAKELFATAYQQGMGRLDFAAIHQSLEK